MPRREDLIDVVALLLAVAIGLVIVIAFFAAATRAQTLVSMDRADAVRGQQHIECWLVPQPAAAIVTRTVIVIDCGSDPDRLYSNGFEVMA